MGDQGCPTNQDHLNEPERTLTAGHSRTIIGCWCRGLGVVLAVGEPPNPVGGPVEEEAIIRDVS